MAAKTFAVTYGATITKKIVMALTGLIWVLFVIGHMVGNLSFVLGGSDAFNLYTYKLTSLGPLLWFIEIALALF